jgi:hypothetical protein
MKNDGAAGNLSAEFEDGNKFQAVVGVFERLHFVGLFEALE